MPDTTPFKLLGFMDSMREWMKREQPSTSLLARVAEWGAELAQDPFRDADADGGPLLFRVVPGTEHNGRVVTLSYRVIGRQVECHTLRCQPAPITSVPPSWPPEPHDHPDD